MGLNIAPVEPTLNGEHWRTYIRINSRRPDFDFRLIVAARLTRIDERKPDRGPVYAIETTDTFTNEGIERRIGREGFQRRIIDTNG